MVPAAIVRGLREDNDPKNCLDVTAILCSREGGDLKVKSGFLTADLVRSLGLLIKPKCVFVS